jgi:hypothetical protein
MFGASSFAQAYFAQPQAFFVPVPPASFSDVEYIDIVLFNDAQPVYLTNDPTSINLESLSVQVNLESDTVNTEVS